MNFFPTKIIVKVVVIELQIDGLITTPLPNKEIRDCFSVLEIIQLNVVYFGFERGVTKILHIAERGIFRR